MSDKRSALMALAMLGAIGASVSTLPDVEPRPYVPPRPRGVWRDSTPQPPNSAQIKAEARRQRRLAKRGYR